MLSKAWSGVANVMHGEHDAGRDLRHEHEGEDAAEGPPIVQIARRGEHHELVVHQPRHRQTLVEPSLDAGRRLVCGLVRHDRELADLDLGV